MSSSVTSRPTAPAGPDTGPDAGPDAVLAADLAEITRRERIERRTRTGLGVGFALIGAALTAPVMPAIPLRLLAAALAAALSVIGAATLAVLVAERFHGRYEVVPHAWGWRIVRRWYAPGATVWHANPKSGAVTGSGPLAVLGWHHDPACAEAWALVYDGTPRMTGGGAVWLPLSALSPTPPPAEPLAQDVDGGAR
ncbi:hypothetical protein [Actinomadura fibrosa]|uniref:Uncharacterized protein n=1 Tax=Actinomadura fibrosa TaxID=111802 RepID=A0ABW2XLC4_9ACTN|nr:hypothetical protein [Actinomadura fibrosa]